MAESIFDFSDFRELLKFRVRKQIFNPAGRRKSNLTRIAREWGYASPSMLSMLLNGKRLPSDDVCETLARTWQLTPREKDHLRLLIQLDRKRRQGQDTSTVVEAIRKVSGRAKAHVFREDEFALVSEWHYLVLKELVSSPTFKEDPNWISRTLRRRITPSQVQQALARLEEVKVLVRDAQSGRLRPATTDTETTNDVPSWAIRNHHEQMLHCALEALASRPVEERFFAALTFAYDLRRGAEIRKRLVEFMRSMNEEFAAEGAEAVGQLNLQFFEHTIRPEAPAQVGKKAYEKNSEKAH